MKFKFLISFFLFSPLIFLSQREYIDKDYDCTLLKWHYQHIKNPTKLDTVLIRIECLDIRDQFSSAMKILDSLIESDPKNGELFFTKASYFYLHNILDTIYFSYQRTAISLNYMSGYSLGTLADYYYNFIIATEDPKNKFQLSNAKKKELLEIAESSCSKAIPLCNRYNDSYLELLVNIQDKKAEMRGIKTGGLNFTDKFDTLTFISQLMDCGEFGGHLEYIKCYHYNNNIVAEFFQDSLYCQDGIDPETLPYNFYKTGRQNIDVSLMRHYINHFNNIDKNPDRQTNAPTSFWVIKDGNMYFVRDWTGNSQEYEQFRDRTFR